MQAIAAFQLLPGSNWRKIEAILSYGGVPHYLAGIEEAFPFQIQDRAKFRPKLTALAEADQSNSLD